MLTIRKAQEAEYPLVKTFYDSLTDAMADAEFNPGWERDVYPAPDFLRSSIANGELYIGELDGQTAACMVVNHAYNEGYRNIAWSLDVPDEELLVIHALGVHPAFAGHGIAKQMARAAQETARQSAVKTIRLDVLEGNLPAERAYVGVGFRYVDTITMFYEDTGWTAFRLFEYLV